MNIFNEEVRKNLPRPVKTPLTLTRFLQATQERAENVSGPTSRHISEMC